MKSIRFLVLTLLILSVTVILSACSQNNDTSVDSTTTEEIIEDTENTECITTVTDTTPEETVPPEPLSSITAFTVPKEYNSNLYETLVGEISDGKITIKISSPTDTYSLKAAYVSVEHDGILTFPATANETVDLTSPECFITVENNKGTETKYRVELEYDENTIPVVCINTFDGQDILTKDYYVDATISIDTSGVDGWYLPEGFESLEPTKTSIKGRGNSTWQWDKKPYKLKFDSKLSILGLTQSKKWVLLANYSDYSLMRNYVVMETSKVLSEETSPFSQFPINLFVNGEYRGVYTIGEDHEVGNGRVELSDNNGTPDTSYMIEVGGYEEDEDIFGKTYFHTDLVRWCSIESPEDDEITQEQADFIIDYVSKADAAVIALDGYENYIDVDALINWFIANELFYNIESCFHRSCFMTKEVGGPLKMGPLWDYDLSMGNLYNDFGRYDIWACLSQEYEYIGDNWFCYLMNDPDFRARLKVRWDEVKDELLATAVDRIDRMGKTLANSAKCNFTVWNILGTRAVLPQPLSIVNLKTYEDNVQYIRDFVINRWNWMDSNI